MSVFSLALMQDPVTKQAGWCFIIVRDHKYHIIHVHYLAVSLVSNLLSNDIGELVARRMSHYLSISRVLLCIS